MTSNNMNTAKYKVNGMHCRSCELLLERELGKLRNIEKVDANLTNSEVQLSSMTELPSSEEVEGVLQEHGYSLAQIDSPISSRTMEWVIATALAGLVLIDFLYIDRLSLGLNTAEISSSLLSSVMFGVVASLSSCTALVGGLLLAQSENWRGKRFVPYIYFNVSRLVSFVVLGGLLGVFGATFSVSLNLSFGLVIIASVFMVILGLQMLDVFPALNKINVGLPKSITSKLLVRRAESYKLAPVLLGVGTFFLPCAFTITSQLRAVSSGNVVDGALVMGGFALGTLPMLLLISLSAKSMSVNKKYSGIFMKMAGLLVIAFAIYTLSNQLNVIGINQSMPVYSEVDLPEVVDGKQRAAVTIMNTSYSPEITVLRRGVPAELTFFGQTYGCGMAIISRDFWDGVKIVDYDTRETIEFTPTQTGRYKYSCSMGMYVAYIDVV